MNQSTAPSGGSREFPMVLRRGSIAPLTARIRANRPPSAPPGSIFTRQEFQLRYEEHCSYMFNFNPTYNYIVQFGLRPIANVETVTFRNHKTLSRSFERSGQIDRSYHGA